MLRPCARRELLVAPPAQGPRRIAPAGPPGAFPEAPKTDSRESDVKGTPHLARSALASGSRSRLSFAARSNPVRETGAIDRAAPRRARRLRARGPGRVP